MLSGFIIIEYHIVIAVETPHKRGRAAMQDIALNIGVLIGFSRTIASKFMVQKMGTLGRNTPRCALLSGVKIYFL
ncbi:hypothetical protein BN938_2868 [Mucinivorans hirudinis]|uniref:Uncharacterized protein n=1 Tax=Mucinivorans hirudinis TaxID=1433126 RepID=A0A060RER5_9BACT|nr:hypothetical protein BN938_2868 [Mucinivorans hirudinis]